MDSKSFKHLKGINAIGMNGEKLGPCITKKQRIVKKV